MSTKKKTTWQKVRKFLNDLHLWAGIGAGLVLFVVCLTGTIYTFHQEIDEAINSDRYYIQAPLSGQVMPIEKLVAAVEAVVEGGTPGSVSIPQDPKKAYAINVRVEGQRRGTNYLVNPYTGEVLGDTHTGASEFFMVMFRLHRWLMLDMAIGRPIVGWSTVIFVFLCLSGLVIWVPQKVKSWRQGLKIKWSANWKRINHDLHNTLGFYSVFLLLVMGLTGLYWSFDAYRDGLYSVLGVEKPQWGRRGNNAKEEEKKEYPASTLQLVDFLEAANQALPYEGDYRIELTSKEKNTLSISKTHTGFFVSSGRDQLTMDKYSNEIVKKEIFSEKPLNQQIAQSIRSIHTGEIFGTFTKILYFISCLIATSLPVTGTIIWINKLKKKRKRKSSKKIVKNNAEALIPA
ncbi:PepSY-associated TM helix domain-containing protein [Reichenbachiella ulvae]|uniref:PepSY domain-containing protein n=1 Tax=Reichenbachiella ulvae TaxID=2980104 RepID=A0ABT3CZ67_9BACT|nr:PepSY-associated TM helix domain-containing protein [Reichenbachiella ulvae]MCV9388937.1 PepSY domain-containing protein [Reichenbachiella ulvae]